MRPIERLEAWEQRNNIESLGGRLMANKSTNTTPLGTLQDIAKKYGIFAALFIALLAFVLNGYEKREDKLMMFLQTQSETNSKIATTLEKLDIRMCSIEARLNK